MVDDAQFRLKKGLGTRNATFMLRTVVERAVEGKGIYIEFGMVRYELFMRRLVKLGVDAADLSVLANLYLGQKTVVKLGD